MTSTMTTTLGTSNLRSSSRQTRTNPTRTSKTLGSSLRQNSLVSNPSIPVAASNEPQNIYPAIQHFTDAVAALPREYRRHTSLLKEVDAKAWAPEETLQKLLSACLATKPPRFPTTSLPSAAASTTGAPDGAVQTSAADSVTGAQNDIMSQASSLPTDPANFPRRKLFYDLRFTLNDLMVTMDEKNHVMNNANEELGRVLQRLNTIFPHLNDEISEEVRLGSSTHWAYAENRASAKALAGGESRSRKEAASGLAIMQNESAARSESRREAVRENKRLKAAAHQQQDSDFDETKSSARRANASGKTKRVGELATEAGAGLGISTASPPARKKRPDKAAVGGVAMERTASGSNIGGASMSRQASQQDATKKRRAPKDNANTGARKRPQTGNSAANSPVIAPSPLVSAFSKEPHRSSPAPRPQGRGRQNSQNDVRGRPASSASNRPAANGVGSARTPDLQQVGAIAGKSTAEVKATMKESANSNGDRLFEDDPKTKNDETDHSAVRGGILLERTSSKASHTEKLKREADEGSETGRGRKNSSAAPSPRLPPSNLAVGDTAAPRQDRRRGVGSKTSTPVATTFEEAANSKSNGTSGRPPNRPSRQNTLTSTTSSSDATPSQPTLPLKRSHKKGAGLAAQAAALAAAKAAQGKPHGDGEQEDVGEGEEEENEPLYCYCQQVSYGEMIACDADDCKREWFHLECAGLDRVPGRNAKWYCDECKERLKKGKSLQGVENSVR